VLRWSWRVAYYAYGALGTDRYPPFTLADVSDYPAHLAVDYPERLSRGLVLVKWWLLAIPHYLVVGFFLSGGLYLGSESLQADNGPWLWGGGLIGLLVLVAAVVLLFSGSYPKPVFDFVLGMNRWVLRVAAYAGLMTDEYPPFRFDAGGDDPGGSRLAVPTAPPPPVASGGTAPPSPTGSTWSAGRIIALVAGSVVLLASLGVGAAGATLGVAGATMRDADGFVMTGTTALQTPAYAIASESMTLHTDPTTEVLPDGLLGDARVTVESTADEPVFVGVAPTADVADYLAGVQTARLVELEGFWGDLDPTYEMTAGEAPATLPADSDIWVAQASGAGEQTLTWPLEDGEWTVVVMNADGTDQVAVDVAAGSDVPWLGAVVGVMLATAGVGLVVALVLMLVALRRTRVRS
jgi:hypothetical protein